MKRLYNILTKIFLFFICIYCIACSKSNNIKSPEIVGKYTFDLLKQFDQINKQTFIDHFANVEQFEDYINSNKDIIDEYFIDRFSNPYINKNEWIDHYLDTHYTIKTEAKDFGINWSGIQYESFKYETEENDGFTTSYGTLFFNYNNVNYSIETTAFKDNYGFKLVDLCSFKIVD